MKRDSHAAKHPLKRSAAYWGRRREKKRRGGPPTTTTLQFHYMLEAYLHGLTARRCPEHIRERLTERKIWEELSATRIHPVPMLVLTKTGERGLFRLRPDLRWA